MHRPILLGVIQALAEIFREHRPANRVVESSLRQHRQWGSRDRRQFAEAVYDLVEGWRAWLWQSGFDWPADDRAPWVGDDGVQRILSVYAHAKGVALEPTTVPRPGLAGESAATRLSYPDWLYLRLHSEMPDWPLIATVLSGSAPVYLRANRLKCTAEQLASRLRADGKPVELVGGDALQLKERANLFFSKEFKDGLFEVQDLNSQAIAPFVQPKPGERVIDACAGAGGKTLHLGTLMGGKGKIIALDTHGKKLEELKLRAARAGVQMIETRPIDSTKVIKRLDASADRVLLDVPCSGLGALRRHRDYKWQLSPEKLADLVALQSRLLDDYSSMVKPGGILVYATCSILRSENQAQVEAFIGRSSTKISFELEKELSLMPQINGGDGFYAARMKRLS